MKHPHGRGEDKQVFTPAVRTRETPPRAWGRRHEGLRPARHRGNTPTGVGKTARPSKSYHPARKHPHGRGEDRVRTIIKRDGQETPPRAWGRLGHRQEKRAALRNTPTGVGKTKLRELLDIGGEETPPRAWGRHIGQQEVYTKERNTPTGVGKTGAGRSAGAGAAKHPHGRGEDLANIPRDILNRETPPRAWGRRLHPAGGGQELGNTPTGVGKTAPPAPAAPRRKKHPHGRGEDDGSSGKTRGNAETPPRAWGRPLHPPKVGLLSGNTPTGVGKTLCLNIYVVLMRKHPHGRGEDPAAFASATLHRETPPRAWGRHRVISHAIKRVGNTPTGVGKTLAGAPDTR